MRVFFRRPQRQQIKSNSDYLGHKSIPGLLNDQNIHDSAQCERTERTFFRSRLQNRKTKCSGWLKRGKISIPRHLADFSGLVAFFKRYDPKAQVQYGRLRLCRELQRECNGKEQTVSILSVTCCVSPGSCHFPPFIFHSHSTLRLSIFSIHSCNTVIWGSETEREKDWY